MARAATRAAGSTWTAAGNIYVTGQTASADYPTTAGVFDRGYDNNTDVFVTKLDSSGSTIAYSTFIGGDAFDSGNGIAIMMRRTPYVAGFSGSLNYPTTPGPSTRPRTAAAMPL